MRKTISVEFIRDRVNVILDPSQTPDLTDDQRSGAESVLLSVLHETGNYRGFRYLEVDHTDPDHEPYGIVIESSGKRYY